MVKHSNNTNKKKSLTFKIKAKEIITADIISFVEPLWSGYGVDAELVGSRTVECKVLTNRTFHHSLGKMSICVTNSWLKFGLAKKAQVFLGSPLGRENV